MNAAVDRRTKLEHDARMAANESFAAAASYLLDLRLAGFGLDPRMQYRNGITTPANC